MNANHPKNSDNEEIDLGQLFNAIGRLFEKLFLFIKGLFTGLFSIIIYALKPVINNFKLISIVLFLAAIIGFTAEKLLPPVYESDMLVQPYFGSKYQLANNVEYFNSLIGEQNAKELSRIFEIDTTDAKALVGFTMEIGPETDNDLLVQYNDYIKSIDSTLAAEVTYEQFIENRDILNAEIFSITATAKKNDIFINLEKGFTKTFENDYSRKLREKRDDTIKLRRASLERQLKQIESLQQVYVQVIQKEAENPEVQIGTDGMFPLQQTKRKTNEYELLERELNIRAAINALDEQLVKEDSYYEILAGFEEVGKKSKTFDKRYSLLFPLIVFSLITIVYFSKKAFYFIKNYD
jgi:hypothetical protein